MGNSHNVAIPAVSNSILGDPRFPYILECHNQSVVELYQHQAHLLYHSCVVHDGKCIASSGTPGDAPPPFILWSTSKDATSEPDEAQQSNAKYLPDGAELRWVGDDGLFKMVQLISAELSQADIVHNVCESLVMLRPTTYHADIWRALVLWKFGGFYMDDSLLLQKSVVDIFPSLDAHSDNGDLYGHIASDAKEWPNLNDSGEYENGIAYLVQDGGAGRPAIYNGMMFASRPRLGFFECVLLDIVSNVAERVYGPSDIFTTGPEAHYIAMKQYQEGLCHPSSDTENGYRQHGIQVRLRYDHTDSAKDHDRTIRDRKSGDTMIVSSRQRHRHTSVKSMNYGHYHITNQMYCDQFYDPHFFPISNPYGWLRYCQLICNTLSFTYDAICSEKRAISLHLHCRKQEGHATYFKPSADLKSQPSIPDPCIRTDFITEATTSSAKAEMRLVSVLRITLLIVILIGLVFALVALARVLPWVVHACVSLVARIRSRYHQPDRDNSGSDKKTTTKNDAELENVFADKPSSEIAIEASGESHISDSNDQEVEEKFPPKILSKYHHK